MDNGAIHRLVRFSVSGREDPSIIEKRTGVPQNLPAQIGGLEIGWAVPYAQRFPSPELSAFIAKAAWMNFWQWGGAPPEAVLPIPQASASLQRSMKEAFDAQFPSDMSAGQGLPRRVVRGGRSQRTTRPSPTAEAYLTLDNGLGDASIGRLQGPRAIVAPGWQSVTGTLSPDGSQIDWTNGTYWLRCGYGQRSRCASRPKSDRDMVRAWLIRSQPCSIRQHGDTLQLNAGKVAMAPVRVDGTGHLTTYWNGNRIEGMVTADGNHINWDNQTYWTRVKIYETKSN